jgi:hypothetical protein
MLAPGARIGAVTKAFYLIRAKINFNGVIPVIAVHFINKTAGVKIRFPVDAGPVFKQPLPALKNNI